MHCLHLLVVIFIFFIVFVFIVVVVSFCFVLFFCFFCWFFFLEEVVSVTLTLGLLKGYLPVHKVRVSCVNRTLL